MTEHQKQGKLEAAKVLGTEGSVVLERRGVLRQSEGRVWIEGYHVDTDTEVAGELLGMNYTPENPVTYFVVIPLEQNRVKVSI